MTASPAMSQRHGKQAWQCSQKCYIGTGNRNDSVHSNATVLQSAGMAALTAMSQRHRPVE
eukprot:4325726-Prorocentrum_lima.AAC.1